VSHFHRTIISIIRPCNDGDVFAKLDIAEREIAEISVGSVSLIIGNNQMAARQLSF